MVVDDILNVLKQNEYSPMGTNLKEMGFFYKNLGDSMNIAAVVNNTGNTIFSGEQLKEVAFQVERKFLLQGRRNVNIQYIIISDNPDRDSRINKIEGINIWVVDVVVHRLIVYENYLPDFEDICKGLETAIDNSQKPVVKQKFNIPFINLLFILVNIIVYIITELNGSTWNTDYMVSCGASMWQLIFEKGQYYRLFTCMFLHFGLSHLLNNMFSLFIIGNEVEKIFGKLKYIVIYIISGIGASLLSAVYYMKIGENVVSAGASGAIFGLIGAMMVGLYCSNRIDGRRIGSRFFLLLAMALYSGSTNVDNMAHAGGFITGTIVAAIFAYFGFKHDNAACKR